MIDRRSFLWSALLPLAPGAARAEGFDEKAVDSLARAALKEWKAPGLALAVVRDDEVVYLKGHGVREQGKDDPVTPSTLFPLASCSKAFTTAAMAMLADEGKLGWDDAVGKHLPWFRLSDALADRSVALRDLVTHRTGLAAHDLLWYRAPWSPADAVRRAGLLPLDLPFRSAFRYQSTMFTAAGLAVAAAARQRWEQFLQQRIFDPLGMRLATCSPADAAKDAGRATGHRLGRGEPEATPFYVHYGPDAAGTVFASARDLTRWLRFQLAGGKAGDRRLVSAAALAETHTPQIPIRLQGAEREVHDLTHQISYGMGWVVQDYRGLKLVSHAGAIEGFRAHLTLVPGERLGIALLNNLDKSQLNLALSNTLLDHLLGLPRRDWHAHIRSALQRDAERAAEREGERLAKRRAGTKPSLETTAYAGDYEHPAYGRVAVSLEKGDLLWTWNTFRGALEHFHFDVFTLPVEALGGPTVQFAIGPDAQVSGMKVGGALGVEFRKLRAGR
jgi:CubicO group peptidase (beta-lactamase class C family)